MDNENVQGVLILGGSSGIGAATARAFAAAGIPVAICARRADRLSTLRKDIIDAGGRADTLTIDLSKPGAAAEAVSWAFKTLDVLDTVVYVAGIVQLSNVAQTSRSRWERHLAVNVLAAAEAAASVLPLMRRQRFGWFIAVGSITGRQALAGAGAYGLSKHALEYLIRLIALENCDAGVRSCLVAPGWVETDLAAEPSLFGVSSEMLLQPEDVANVIIDLVFRPKRVAIGPVIEILNADPRADGLTAFQTYVKHISIGKIDD